MILISDVIDVHPDDRAAFLRAIDIVVAPSRAEPGCRRYGFSQDMADANRFHLFEAWADEASLQRHFATPHFNAYRAIVGPLRLTRGMIRYTAEELAANAGPKPS